MNLTHTVSRARASVTRAIEYGRDWSSMCTTTFSPAKHHKTTDESQRRNHESNTRTPFLSGRRSPLGTIRITSSSSPPSSSEPPLPASLSASEPGSCALELLLPADSSTSSSWSLSSIRAASVRRRCRPPASLARRPGRASAAPAAAAPSDLASLPLSEGAATAAAGTGASSSAALAGSAPSSPAASPATAARPVSSVSEGACCDAGEHGLRDDVQNVGVDDLVAALVVRNLFELVLDASAKTTQPQKQMRNEKQNKQSVRTGTQPCRAAASSWSCWRAAPPGTGPLAGRAPRSRAKNGSSGCRPGESRATASARPAA